MKNQTGQAECFCQFRDRPEIHSGEAADTGVKSQARFDYNTATQSTTREHKPHLDPGVARPVDLAAADAADARRVPQTRDARGGGEGELPAVATQRRQPVLDLKRRLLHQGLDVSLTTLEIYTAFERRSACEQNVG